jgi:hypothetical protein
MGGPASSYATAGIALRVIGVLKPPHHDKVETPRGGDLLGLYEIFMNRKYDVCLEENFKIPKTNLGVAVARIQWVQTNVENNQTLTLKMLFAEEQLAPFHINSHCNSLDEDLTRTGIVQISYDGKLHFIHRTFAEFYVADYFVKVLTKEPNISQQIWDLLLKEIFLVEEYQVIRVFIDGLLSRSEPSFEVIKQYGNRTHGLRKDVLLTLHTAVDEGNVNIIGFLLDTMKKQDMQTLGLKLLLAPNFMRHTAWHVAANNRQIEVLKSVGVG